MKILYDHQIFSYQKYGGISRYFYELIKNIGNDEAKSSTEFSNNHYLKMDKDIHCKQFLANYRFRGKNRLLNMVNEVFSIVQIKNGNFEIFHPTFYNTYFLKYLKGKPFVLTVHDMIDEKFPEMSTHNKIISNNKMILANKANKIIAVSKCTKKDLIDIFGIEKSKIEVVYHGNSMLLQSNVDINLNIPKKYILFVGKRGGYKNFNLFIESVSRLLLEDLDLFVVCIGGDKFKSDEIDLFEELGIQDFVLQFNLDDNLLAQFYSKALAFVFPSKYEGFGMPILESFACNCPVICSNTSSLPEIAGDGAVFFDPYSKDSIRSAVKRVIRNNVLRTNLINKGKERLKDFSWIKTTLETKKIYENILK